MEVLRKLKLQNSGSEFVLPRISNWDKGEQARELRMFLTGLRLPAVRFHDLRGDMGHPPAQQGRHPCQGDNDGGLAGFEDNADLCAKGGRRSSRGDRLPGFTQPLTSAGGSGFKVAVDGEEQSLPFLLIKNEHEKLQKHPCSQKYLTSTLF